MRVGFMHSGKAWHDATHQLAEIMVRSVHKTMPGVEIVQMCDLDTPMVRGVDTVIHRAVNGQGLMLYRLDHLRNFPAGDAMFIDTDAVVQRDVRPVFKKPFDVALTRRTGVILVDGKDIVPEMPYNTGVIFSRSQEFWIDCYEHCATLSDKLKKWFGDQLAVRFVTESGEYNVMELTCNEYNYSPFTESEDVSGRYVAHYKGVNRKFWMLNKYMATTEVT